MKTKKTFLVTALLAALCAANLIYSLMTLNREQEFLRYHTPSLYHENFYEEGRYPDLFVRTLIRDKKVVIPREIKTYDEYSSFGRDEEDGNPFDKNYLIENDYIRYFSFFAKEAETDTSLPSMEETGETLKAYRDEMVSLGIANDMLRYSFALNHEEVQQARGFWYFWYYHHFADKEPDRPESYPEVYVYPEGLNEAESLLVLWDENENLYILPEETYKR